MKKILTSLLTATLLAGFVQTKASAQVLTDLITAPPGGFSSTNEDATYGGSVGSEFTLASNETLVTLGLYVIGSQTSATPYVQEVGLYSTTGTLLASADVTVVGATDHNTFQFALAVDSAGFNGTLVAGTDYILGTTGATGYVGDVYSSTVSPGVTQIESRYSSTSSGGFQFPDTYDHLGPVPSGTNTGLAYVGPNLQFTTPVVPEPSTYALAGAGLLALVLLQRSRNRTA